MTRVREALSNGAWRSWLLGIIATIVATLIVNNIAFQRDTKEKMATNEQRIRSMETTSRDTIIREFERQDKQLADAAQRFERRLDALERRIEALEKK
jgi:hypothetical protein